MTYKDKRTKKGRKKGKKYPNRERTTAQTHTEKTVTQHKTKEAAETYKCYDYRDYRTKKDELLRGGGGSRRSNLKAKKGRKGKGK